MTARRITELSDAQACLWEAQDEDATRPILDEYSAHTRREQRRARCARQQASRLLLCADCGAGTSREYYAVKDEIWAAASLPPRSQPRFLCIACLEHRISRRLTRTDFAAARINDLDDPDWSLRSDRLINRLSKP